MNKQRPDCRRSGCPVSFTLDFIGDKWSLLIVRDIAFKGKRYFGEFLDAGEGIASNILANRLHKLEAANLIAKVPDPTDGKKSIYYLTDAGIALLPVMIEMVLWGAAHDPKTAAPPETIRRIKSDRNGFLRQVVRQLKADRRKYTTRR